MACRTLKRVEGFLRSELVEAIVVDVRGGRVAEAATLVERFPRIPVFGCSRFRPDDGRLLTRCGDAGFADVLVLGVDDPVMGELVAGTRVTETLARMLAGVPAQLRLTETVQLRAWETVLRGAHQPLRTDDVAAALAVSREHLSREFAAGGAPNLKRVIDLVRLALAAYLLGNPGYTVGVVAAILGYSSASHLSGAAARVAGVRSRNLGRLGPLGVAREFRGSRTRSRL